MNTKLCNGCGASLSLTQFYRSDRGKFGVQSQCKECRKRTARAKYRVSGRAFAGTIRKRFTKNMRLNATELWENIRKRFYQKFHADVSGCWLWGGSKNIYGYGRFHFTDKLQAAHRCSYILHVGSIPEGMQVLHRCDTPGCVNPAHLFLGTHLDNMRDKARKGRCGNTHPNHEQTVRRRICASGQTLP